MNKMFELKNWSICNYITDSFYAAGNVYNNPRFYDGKYINTSPISEYRKVGSDIIITTKNSEYYLAEKNRLISDNNSGIDNMCSILDRENDRLMRAAEMLLHRGDCLLYCSRLCYCSENGLIRLKGEKNEPDSGLVFSYVSDGFVLEIESCMRSNNYEILQCTSNIRGSCIYHIFYDPLQSIERIQINTK